MSEHGDRLIGALFQTLPAAGSDWPRAKREKWLAAMKSFMDLVYLDSETTTDHPVDQVECRDE